MAVPNIGPVRPDPNDPDDAQRGGNAAQVYRADLATDDVHAASARASSDPPVRRHSLRAQQARGGSWTAARQEG